MNKKLFITLIVIVITLSVAIIVTIVGGIDQSSNSKDMKFEQINLTDAKISRYNEMLNISQVSYLVSNLAIVFGNGFNIEEAINYAYVYAYSFKDDYESNVLVEGSNIYLPSVYLENIIEEIFDRKEDLAKYIKKDGYILVNDEVFAKDAISLSLVSLSYSKNNELYRAIIAEDDKRLEITYRQLNNKFVILEYKENI